MSKFQFKKFTITHHTEVFKFGTDAALLSMSIPLQAHQKVLEIGVGTGVVSMVLSQRKPSLEIIGIDFSQAAIACAQNNLSHFELPHKIEFLQSDLQSFQTDMEFDLILSNPPFFDHSTKSKSLINARHTDSLSLRDLIINSQRLLSDSGSLVFIYPSRYMKNIIEECAAHGLFILGVTYFKDSEDADIKRVIVTISKKDAPCIENTVIIKGPHHGYSAEVAHWFTPFYLKF